MKNAFGCPSHLVDSFRPQNSSSKPESNSTSRPEESIEYLIHRAINTGLSGAHLDALTARFQEYLVKQIEDSASGIGADWSAFPDLTSFVEKHVFEAAIRSMFGTYLFSLNPTLAEDFWNYNRCIGALFVGLPRWLNPAAYKAREKMLKNLERWQKYAPEHCDIANLGDVESQPYYGSKYTRERQSYLTKCQLRPCSYVVSSRDPFGFNLKETSMRWSSGGVSHTVISQQTQKLPSGLQCLQAVLRSAATIHICGNPPPPCCGPNRPRASPRQFFVPRLVHQENRSIECIYSDGIDEPGDLGQRRR